MFKAYLRNEKAATTIEYGVIAAFVVIGIIANLSIIGPGIVRLIETATRPLR
ncbi:Flp family type IVb pilin [Chelatococcus asaccharovorans]|uniref:Flp/Fap pilin component n=1 Tax=Chelatococcus asaccharovorans TaxID=28210 RepID=A0A2V3U200_9HYPH|nr:Flp family type IVb pilin [Chelatococcus asaccharovorans]MBS7702283.1 Flp family type IVb pilin [Chelatococcus asaccharovorans]PXW56516.1 Flp/Fap pilin component [Chelatococcus asaccharovorans]CAH1669281.1 Flp/Fap pilin component [Chelatococcus asaccharovorans]CAH1679273.1 Flp/Fap pilin component [Chelatococcus asaccharovorans]